MIFKFLIISLYNCFSLQELIKNGVYILKLNNLFLCENKRSIFFSKEINKHITLFRIKKSTKIKDYALYEIENSERNYKLIILDNKELFFSNRKDNVQLWEFKKNKNNLFTIKSKDNCFLIEKNSKLICETNFYHKASLFEIIKIYSEVEEENQIINYELINKEPIDVLIKYIDLRDPKLHRLGIHQIEKDYDNEELRYSIRSILKNIPWIRKIFILMPNEEVRYFKNINLIKEKIIYIKDKDLLGYDSSNSRAFQFRYWKMKKFGISDNIIILDDDYFIGDKLEKTDFFYVENGKVLPSIPTSKFLKINKIYAQKKREVFYKKSKISKKEQTGEIFHYNEYSTILFILNLFNIQLNDNIFIPLFTHNAIPVNLNDIKEIYNLIYKSKYKYVTLDCPYRHSKSLQFQIFILTYTFLKYNRKIHNIPYRLYSLDNAIKGNYKSPLFCINKGPYLYSNLNIYQEKIVMEYLFPEPSLYEVVDYSILNSSINCIYSTIKKKDIRENKNFLLISRNDFFYIEIIKVLLFILIIIKLKKKAIILFY